MDPLGRKSITKNIRETGPALGILLATLIISTFIAEFTFTFGIKAVWLNLVRFLRLTLVLTLPLFLLPGICSLMKGFFNQGNRHLIQVQEDRDTALHPLKSWVVRPLQGIGLAMLIATKLLDLLQVYQGSTITVSTILPPRTFSLWTFLSATAIGVAISLLLSFLWTLDDLGVRLFNRKTREVKMIGRYVGLLLPILFGFYGIISHFEGKTQLLAAKYIAQMVIVLYPPFVVFTVLHSRYMKRREAVLLGRLKAARKLILADGTEEKANFTPGRNKDK